MKKIERCPNCDSANIRKVHCLSRFFKHWYHIECWNCHWCGKTKLFLHRAIKSWNKQERRTKR